MPTTSVTKVLAEIELFITAAELQNFGRAALALNMTPSTLSRRLAHLEAELGLLLVRRSTRSFALTEAGQQFLHRARKIKEMMEQTKEELSASFNLVSGPVRAGAPFDLAATILAPAFTKFCCENATVSLDIVSTQGQPNLDRDKLDVAFSVAHQVSLPDSPYATRPIGSFARMLYASKLYLKRRGTPQNPHDLGTHSCIRYLDTVAETQWRLHREKRTLTVAVAGPFTSTSVMVSAQAARQHLGIALLPHHLAAHPTYGAGLIRVLPEWEGTPANVVAVTADRKVPVRVEELIRLVRSEFATRVAQLETTQD